MSEEYQEKLLKVLEAISKNILAIATRMEIKKEIEIIQEIEKKEPVKRPNAPKIVLGVVYKIAAKKCDKCKGLISWDDFDANTHRWPTHVNESGQIIGDGSCPEATF